MGGDYVDDRVFGVSYHFKNGLFLFEVNSFEILKHFICSYENVWSIFEEEYGMTDEEIIEMIKTTLDVKEYCVYFNLRTY